MLNLAKSSDEWPAYKLKLVYTGRLYILYNLDLKLGRSCAKGTLAMAARSASQDSKIIGRFIRKTRKKINPKPKKKKRNVLLLQKEKARKVLHHTPTRT